MNPPTASILLLTYNQEAYVADALTSLLEQDVDDIEVVISDDDSTDRTWEIICQLCSRYAGPKKVIKSKNAKNIGVVANYYQAFSLSSGSLIFTAAGDDISLPSRCSKTIAYWMSCEVKPDLIAADGYDMAEDGHILGVKRTAALTDWNLKRWIEQRPYVFGASHMMTRRLVGLRPLHSNLRYEDQNFVARALMMNGASTLSTPLVKHRRGGISQRRELQTTLQRTNRLVESAKASILQSNEIIEDAALLDRPELKTLLNETIDIGNYAIDLLTSRRKIHMLEIVQKYKHLPIRKHFKYIGHRLKMYAAEYKNRNQLRDEKS